MRRHLGRRDCNVPDFAFSRSLRTRSSSNLFYNNSYVGCAKCGARSFAHPFRSFAHPLRVAGAPCATTVTMGGIDPEADGSRRAFGARLCLRPTRSASEGSVRWARLARIACVRTLAVAASITRIRTIGDAMISKGSDPSKGSDSVTGFQRGQSKGSDPNGARIAHKYRPINNL
jgi:hypothetical protein